MKANSTNVVSPCVSEAFGVNSRALTLLLLFLSPFAAWAAELGFSDFPVGSVYSGKPAKPDFLKRDKGFAAFKTRILNGMNAGPNFAGEYSVIQFGCGTGCSTAIVASNRTGEVFGFPRGGEFNQALTLSYQANSRLMIARWYTDSLWETCVFESLVFENENWITKEALASKGDNACESDPVKGFAKAKGL